MTKTEFLNALSEHGVSTENVNFDDPVWEGYGIRKVYYRWETFYRERGNETEVMGHPSESEALMYLYRKLVRF